MDINTPSPNQIQPLLKVVQIAETLNVSRTLAYQLIQLGKIRSVRINGAVRVRPEDLEKFIEGNLSPAE
jgi:excisionase family DNA binding protein